MTVALDRIGQIAIRAHDVDRATAFYRDTLGMTFLFAFPGIAFFQCGEVRLMLSRPEQAELDHPGSILYYKVDDIEAAHAELTGKGVAFMEPPKVVHRGESYDLWLASFHDSEANVACLMHEKYRE